VARSAVLGESRALSDVKDILALTSEVFARVGFEIGRFMKTLEDEGINWGYFIDHTRIHQSNAHANNWIVLPPGLSQNQLIAPVDFDFAYAREEFININYEEESYGKQDLGLFAENQSIQQANMRVSLSGLELMTNFTLFQGLPEQLVALTSPGSAESYETYKIAFTDTLMTYYLAGNSGAEIECFPEIAHAC